MMSTEKRPVNKGRYADTRILIKEMNELIADIQAIAPEISIAQLQMNSDLPSNELYNIRGGNVTKINRIREANRFLRNTKSFLEKTEVKKTFSMVEERPQEVWRKQIESLCNEHNLTHTQISAALNMTHTAAGKWISGDTKPTNKSILKINNLYKKRHEPDFATNIVYNMKYKGIGRDIIRIKELTGWSEREMGKKLGTTNSVINRWKNGHVQPSKKNEDKIRKMLEEVETKALDIESEVIETKTPEKKYSLIERIKFLFTGKI